MTHVLKWLFWSEDTFDGQVDVVGDDYFFAGGHRNFSTNDDLFAGAEKMDRIDLKKWHLPSWKRDKREAWTNKLRPNLSVLLTEHFFLDAVQETGPWPYSRPVSYCDADKAMSAIGMIFKLN